MKLGIAAAAVCGATVTDNVSQLHVHRMAATSCICAQCRGALECLRIIARALQCMRTFDMRDETCSLSCAAEQNIQESGESGAPWIYETRLSLSPGADVPGVSRVPVQM